MTAESTDRTYRLEPLDASGVFIGLSIVQCVLLGTGLTLAVAGITAGAPVMATALPIVAAALASFVRVGRHPVWAWLPLLTGWLWTGLRRGRRWHAPLPLWGQADGRAPMPPCLDGLDIVPVAWRPSSTLGAIRDKHRYTLTSVIPVTGPQFIVEPRCEQERLLAGWGDVLAQFAVEGGVVTHLAWSDLARPSGMDQHLAWIADGPTGEPHADARHSYRELVEVGTGTATSHDVVVTVTVARDRLGRRRTGASTTDALERALVSSTEALLRALRTAGLTAGEPFDPSRIQRLIRTRIDPVPGHPQKSTGRLIDRLALVSPATAGPLALEAGWSHLRVDAAFHRTWWIGTWPRLAVPPAWLEPFLSGGGVTRTMTVIVVPVPTHQSRRRIERDLVKLDSDATAKEDNGRRVDARHRRATQALLHREEELVAGFPEMAYAGLVTVSTHDLDTLEEHAEIIEQLARANGMDLRVLDARQDVAWAAALPLGLAPTSAFAS